MALPNTVKKGSVSPTIQDRMNSRPMRMNMAMNKPILRASSCWALGSLSTRIEMKMMLSIPSTSSNRVRVANAIQICGFDNNSIMMGRPVLFH